MKRLTTSLFAALTVLFVPGQLLAADPDSSFGLAPSAAPQIPAPAVPQISAPPAEQTPASSATDSPLIPEVTPAAAPSTTDGTKAQYQGMNKTEVAEDKLHNRVQWRNATAKAERDPGLQAIKARALAARTDFEQRAIFVDYYNKLFDLIAKIDPTIKKEELDRKKGMYASRFVQGRVAPTIDPASFHHN